MRSVRRFQHAAPASVMTGVAIVLALAMAPPAFAQSKRPASDKTGELVEAGTRAYAAGKYDFAIQALSQAYQLSRQPSLLFSIAEAYRQRFALQKQTYDLAQAVAHYRQYRQLAPQGEHAARAERALANLEPRLEGAASDEDSLAASAAQQAVATRLSVMSPALNAAVRIDGGPARSLPVFVEVTPGRHRLALTAPGYRDEVREVFVAQGSVYPANISLDPKPSQLSVDAPSGARIYVDGKFAGTTPLSKPIDAEPGSRFVSVSLTGFVPQGRLVELERGKAKKVAVDLQSTGQRRAAWVLIGTSGVALATGITLGVLSVVEHRKARELEQDSDDREFEDEAQREYDAAISARDDFRIGSGIAAGTGLGLFLLGGTLFVFDNPALPARAKRGQRPGSPRSGGAPALEVSATPLIGPSIAGGSFGLRF